MFDDPSAKYRPAADNLLSRHGLTVDDSTRDLLAGAIMYARRQAGGQAYSPVPMTEKALRHARKLRQYLDAPPRRKASISTRYSKLYAALCESWPLYFHLAVEMGAECLSGIADTLGAGDIDTESLDALIKALDAIVQQDWRAVGRPGSAARKAVRAGCIVWLKAGQPKLGPCYWDNHADEAKGALRGALADFQHDLLAVCGVFVSDATLKSHVDECRKDHEFKRLHKNA